MLDAGILIVYEGRFRPENMRVESFVEYQRDKVHRAFAQIKAENASYTNGATPNAVEIALASAIDHYDFPQEYRLASACAQFRGVDGRFCQSRAELCRNPTGRHRTRALEILRGRP